MTPAQRKRYFAYLTIAGVMLAVIIWDYYWHRWKPDFSLETEHYVIHSTATQEQAEEIGGVAEALYTAYMEYFDELLASEVEHDKLKAKLYKDRFEFRLVNRIDAWEASYAEAFYRKPYCHQYYSASEANPYHWMLHEATHQLNAEVAGFKVAQWLEEGVACYFSTGHVRDGILYPGIIDRNTYPVWHLTRLAYQEELEQDLEKGHVIPLRAIITGEGGPELTTHFNLYYLHWWSLAHFLFQHNDGAYRTGMMEVIQAGGDLRSFEEHIGPVEQIQTEWHEHVLELKNPDSKYYGG